MTPDGITSKINFIELSVWLILLIYTNLLMTVQMFNLLISMKLMNLKLKTSFTKM